MAFSHTLHRPLQTLDSADYFFGARGSRVRFSAARGHQMKNLFGTYPHLGKILFDLAVLFNCQRIFGGHTAASLAHSRSSGQETLFCLMHLLRRPARSLGLERFAVKNSRSIEDAAERDGFGVKPIER